MCIDPEQVCNIDASDTVPAIEADVCARIL